MSALHLSTPPPVQPPLDPTAIDARHQLANELAKGQYAAARPTWLDLASEQLQNWFNSLFNRIGGGIPGGSALIIVVIIAAIVAAMVIGFLIFGLPRINRRSAVAGALFGDEDDRTSDTLRQAAERAADAGDFATAIEEIFRTIARGLAERVIVTTFPGTTAHTFSARAGEVFPEFRDDLSTAADAFDRVRYLGSAGTAAEWLAVRALDASLRQTKPVLEPVAP